MRLAHPVVFCPMQGNPEGYTVEFLDLPGAVTEGASLAEAILMAQDLAAGWVLDELEDGNRPPAPSEWVTLDEPDGRVALVAFDVDDYGSRYGSRAVRKNVTIPAYLDTWGEANDVNYSRTLRERLEAMYLDSSKGLVGA